MTGYINTNGLEIEVLIVGPVIIYREYKGLEPSNTDLVIKLSGNL